MRGRPMFTVLILRSLRNRWGRVYVAVLAVAVGAALTSSLLTISMGVEGLVERELRGYGANILVTPKGAILQVGSGGLGFGSVAEKKSLSEESLNEIRNAVPDDGLVGYVPYLYVPVEVESGRVVFAGTWPDEVRAVSPWWRVDGSWVADRSSLTEVMLGRVLAEKMGIQIGGRLKMSHGGHVEEAVVVGILSTGGPEDDQIVGSLRLAQRLDGEPGAVHMVWVSVLAQGGELERVAESIGRRLPDAEVKTIGQVAQAEEHVLGKMSFVIILVTSLVLTASGLGVMSTMSTSVMERRCEIGLMKALGAEDRRISLIHLTEASLIGLTGGAIGYITGSMFATLVGLQVYGRALPPQPIVLLFTTLISLGVVLLASVIPVKNALRVEAAVVLRGE